MKHDLQQEITQLAFQIRHVTARNRIGHLVGFFDRVRRNACEVLFEIPGASSVRVPERPHQFKKIVDFIEV